MREKWGIKGSGFKDCCATFWCTPCTLAQMNMEVKKRGEVARAASAGAVGGEKGYGRVEGGMVYQAPNMGETAVGRDLSGGRMNV